MVRGRCATHAQQKERARPNADVRRWYHTARWQRLRLLVLREQPLCPLCREQGRYVAATDVDHDVPHRGDHARFWDRANLVALCHAHHSAKTRRGE